MGQLVFQATLGGQVNLVGPNTASVLNIDVPAFAGTMASLASVTNNGVTYVNSSGQPTSGSGFVFDGTNVGIGTSSPTEKLTVVGGNSTQFTIDNTGQQYTSMFLKNNGTTKATLYWDNTNAIYNINAQAASSQLALWTANSERMRIDTSGNVGIGTSSPQTRLHAFSSATTTTVSIQGSLSAGANTPTLDFTGNNGGYSYGARIQAIRDTSAGGYSLAFGTTTNNAAEGSAPTERMRIDSSGNVGIGTSSPAVKLDVSGNIQTSSNYMASVASYVYSYAGGTNSQVRSGIYMDGTNQILASYTANTERARIDSSGNLLVGTTSTIGSATGVFQVKGAASQNAMQLQIGTNGNNGILFYNASASAIGSIVVNSGSVAYNTTSDYRLKENVQPMTGALEKVSALKPVTYTWKATGESTQGFIAHELAEVVPQCVTGEKDAVDEDGNPQYQGIDTSFLVATLTAAIQEQQALITQLTERISALEGKA